VVLVVCEVAGRESLASAPWRCGDNECPDVLSIVGRYSKGFGFVEMPKPGEAKFAMQAINGKEIDGYKVRVKKATV
jgi:hypothetical protein